MAVSDGLAEVGVDVIEGGAIASLRLFLSTKESFERDGRPAELSEVSETECGIGEFGSGLSSREIIDKSSPFHWSPSSWVFCSHVSIALGAYVKNWKTLTWHM